nr:EOG090X0E0F [Ilyocryptus agilis]
MESLVKLCAESLHVVLLGLCTRKARRKEKADVAYGDAEHKLYLESTVLERKVPEADLRQLIDLPPGLDLNEWLASHTIAFFEHVNLLYGAISEYCTPTSCPDMLGPGQRQYTWIDERGKKLRLSAPQYIDYVMTYSQRVVNDESIFPTKFAQEFPTTYEQVLKKIQRLLFHVIAHLYHRHFRELLLLGLHGHLHGLFAHLILFNSRFRLIEDKETEILHDLVVALRLQPTDDNKPTSSSSSSTPPPVASRSTQPSPTPFLQQPDSSSSSAAAAFVSDQAASSSAPPAADEKCEAAMKNGGDDPCGNNHCVQPLQDGGCDVAIVDIATTSSGPAESR